MAWKNTRSSDDEWKLEQGKVINDIKLGFRHGQIEDEGNDPVKTGESFGTPHDLAAMSQQQGDDGQPKQEGGSPEGGFEGAGRPKEPGTYKTDDNPFGRDPLGQKTDIKPATTYDKYKNSPLAYEQKEALSSSLKKVKRKTRSVIVESLKEEAKNTDNGGLLDESNLIDDTV